MFCVVNKDGTVKKVQVKTTRCKSSKYSFSAQLASSGGTREKGTIKPIDEVDFEILFIYTESSDIYTFTKEQVIGKRSITLPYPKIPDAWKCRLFKNEHPLPTEITTKQKEDQTKKWIKFREKNGLPPKTPSEIKEAKEKKERSRKFNPSKEELLTLWEQENFVTSKVARHYGVSDNAIRRRLKTMGENPNSPERRKKEEKIEKKQTTPQEVEDALKQCNGNVAKAAKLLEVKREYLRWRIGMYNLQHLCKKHKR